jgi:hypothetical protein
MTYPSFPKPPHPLTSSPSRLSEDLHTSDAQSPALIRYANTPEGLLSQRDPDALRQFVLQAPDANDMQTRQQSLWHSSSQTLAVWRGFQPTTPVDAQRSRSAIAGEVVTAQVLAWPMVLTLDQQLQIRSIFDCNQGKWPGLARAMTRAWSQCLNIPASNIRVHEAILARQLAGVSPLLMQSLTLAGRDSVQANLYAASPPATGAIPQMKAALNRLAENFETHTAVGPDHAQVFLLTALVATEVGTAHEWPRASNLPGKLAMQSLMESILTHALSSADQTTKTTLRPIRPTCVLGDIAPICDAITQAQGMELAWWAQYGRKTDCSVQLKVGENGTVLHWSMALSSADEERTVIDYAYESIWRPENHRDAILAQSALAQATGQLVSDLPKEAYIQ